MIGTRSTGGLARIRINKDDVKAAKATLSGIQNGFVRAYARALNKTTDGVATDMVTLIRDDYNFKAKAIRGRIKKDKAVFSNIKSAVYSSGRRLLLSDVTGYNQTKKGVTIDVKKSTGRKLIPHAFVGPGRYSGKKIIYIRARTNEEKVHAKGKAQLSRAMAAGEWSPASKRVWRYPIMALYGPYPEDIYNTPQNWAIIEDKASNRLAGNFAHEVDYVLSRYA